MLVRFAIYLTTFSPTFQPTLAGIANRSNFQNWPTMLLKVGQHLLKGGATLWGIFPFAKMLVATANRANILGNKCWRAMLAKMLARFAPPFTCALKIITIVSNIFFFTGISTRAELTGEQEHTPAVYTNQAIKGANFMSFDSLGPRVLVLVVIDLEQIFNCRNSK